MPAEVESLRKSLKSTKVLVEVSGLINSITDYDELLRAILDVARRVILAEAASLFFVNKETGALELAITSFADGQFIEPRISVPRGQGHCRMGAHSWRKLADSECLRRCPLLQRCRSANRLSNAFNLVRPA